MSWAGTALRELMAWDGDGGDRLGLVKEEKCCGSVGNARQGACLLALYAKSPELNPKNYIKTGCGVTWL